MLFPSKWNRFDDKKARQEGRGSRRVTESGMSDILIGAVVFGLVFGAAIFGMFLGRNL